MIIPNERWSPADESKPVTDEYIRALNLNKKILVSAQLAQQSLYEMCMAFKEMRDSKLYKELGYSDFGDYCEQETGFKRSQAYNYISIAEKLPADFVHSSGQIGVKKLTLLATISEEERAQITAETDLESATVKELEQQIKQLRADRDKAVAEKSAAEADSALKADAIAALEKAKRALDERIADLGKQVKELESRPVEVAVETREVIPPDYVTREAYEQMTETLQQQREEAETSELKTKRELNAQIEAEREKCAELEKRIEELKNAPPKTVEIPAEGTEVFNAYLKTAYDALNRLVEYVREQDNAVYSEKTVRLIDGVKSSLGGAV